MNDVSELQVKRAVNIIWNCADDHELRPDFKAYDAEGQADIYWNCIFGAAHRHYEYEKLAGVFRAFEQYEDAETYQGLFWLGLEGCVFRKEVGTRPVLASLRRNYAEGFLKAFPDGDGYHLYEALASAHWKRVLGIEPKMSRYDIKLLDELEFSDALTTDGITELAEVLFRRWFDICTEEKKKEKKFTLLGIRKRKASLRKSRFKKFGTGFAEHSDTYGGGAMADGQNRQLKTKMTETELRAFMVTKFGKPVFTAREISEAERTLCRGSHADCHLHFTNGERVNISEIQNGFEALERQREAEQIEKNRRSYEANIVSNRINIARLTDKIQNSVLLHMQPSPVKSNNGALCGGKVWRAVELGDSRVFTKTENDNMGELTVDILLDASTSQKYRQETVSAQGFMIAESLTRCAIPCRVMSFCSMTGYTVVRIFRDYNKPSDNKRIFEYVSNGCNRDGLAISAARYLMSKTPSGHKLLIILSDVKPNDVIKTALRQGDEPEPYEGAAGITNTALEVRRARAEGISVLCVFTGNDEDVPSAKLVYGRDFARIQSLDKLADTVGRLIQNRIKSL